MSLESTIGREFYSIVSLMKSTIAANLVAYIDKTESHELSRDNIHILLSVIEGTLDVTANNGFATLAKTPAQASPNQRSQIRD